MFDNNFDPYQSMINMDNNIHNLIKAHNLLAQRVEEQGHTIDILIESLNKSNKANEILMREMATNINSKIKEMK